eukprot:m.33070 g.33070  ORF g.33070 m.33070 type:complete len:157 (-) comp5591_c0_seq3:1153-1623(-)
MCACVHVCVCMVQGQLAVDARAAGAAHVGDAELIDAVVHNKVTFDVLMATPDMMRHLRPVAKILRKQMPSEKNGTVTNDMRTAVPMFRSGLSFRTDPQGCINMAIGRTTFSEEQLMDNLQAAIAAIMDHQISNKGNFIKQMTLSTTQGKGIRVHAP